MAQAPPGGVPTVLRLILGKQLQALREKAGLSHEQAAEAIYTSAWTIRRMERADGGLTLNNVKGLLIAYGITSAGEIDTFLALTREANKPGWWHRYSDVLPPWFRVFPGLEQAAELIRGFEPHCVPGLLQTEDYAPAIMRAQITHLIDAAARPHITLQILPLAAGPHPAMAGLFYLFRFTGLPDIVYGETMTSAFYLEKPPDVATCALALDRVCAQAAPAEQTPRILRDTRKEI